VITLAGGIRWERLTPGPDEDVEFIYIVYPAGSESCPPDTLSRHGGKEYGFVVSGTLGVQVGSSRHVVHANDSVSFESAQPHRLYAVGDKPAVAVWAVLNRRGDRGDPPRPR
jgi:mannose-6-phosphate isomerase-like protein (cupin superfamily)